MENANRLSDGQSDYLALCLDRIDHAPKQRIGTARQLPASAHTTEFYALRTASRDGMCANWILTSLGGWREPYGDATVI